MIITYQQTVDRFPRVQFVSALPEGANVQNDRRQQREKARLEREAAARLL